MIITKTIEWDMGHRIPNHKSKCRSPHGHRYKLEIFLQGDITTEEGVSEEGMVLDFSDIKKVLIQIIDHQCDHAFILSDKDKTMVEFYKKNSNLKHLTVPFVPTAENIAVWLFEKLNQKFKQTYKNKLALTHIKLWETPKSAVIYTK